MTVSPSTVITTGSVSVSPTAASVLSISMTSPTATFCCLLPARTIAYTAVSFVGLRTLQVCRSEIVGPEGARTSGEGRRARRSAPRVHRTRCAVVARKTGATASGRPARQPLSAPDCASHQDRNGRRSAVRASGGSHHVCPPSRRSPHRRGRGSPLAVSGTHRGRPRPPGHRGRLPARTPTCTRRTAAALGRPAPSSDASWCATPRATPATPAATAGSRTSDDGDGTQIGAPGPYAPTPAGVAHATSCGQDSACAARSARPRRSTTHASGAARPTSTASGSTSPTPRGLSSCAHRPPDAATTHVHLITTEAAPAPVSPASRSIRGQRLRVPPLRLTGTCSARRLVVGGLGRAGGRTLGDLHPR